MWTTILLIQYVKYTERQQEIISQSYSHFGKRMSRAQVTVTKSGSCLSVIKAKQGHVSRKHECVLHLKHRGDETVL